MHQQGFSLIELLMGLAIAAIVLPWACASYTALVEASERKDAAQLLASGLRSARSEAITRNRTVVIRGIDNDWGRGWRITLDDKEKTLLMEHSGRARVIGNWPVARRTSPSPCPRNYAFVPCFKPFSHKACSAFSLRRLMRPLRASTT